jgi:hypothetical protein
MPYDGIAVPPTHSGYSWWFPCESSSGPPWHPVKPDKAPWMQGRPQITVARTYPVECGPQLLRAADAE